MNYRKNTIKSYILKVVIFLISSTLVFLITSCKLQLYPLKYNNTVIRNISCSSAVEDQEKTNTPYFNNGKIECHQDHGTVSFFNISINSRIHDPENCILADSLNSMMLDINTVCKDYIVDDNEESIDTSNNKNTEDTKQDIQNNDSQQKNEEIDQTSKNIQESQQAEGQNDFIGNLLNLVNSSRNQDGLSPLNLNSSLNDIASIRSQDMIDRNYFSHTTPEGKNIFNILQEHGIAYAIAGENIQYSYPPSNASSAQYFNTWMSSSVHRANILNPNYSQIGIGASFNNDRFVAIIVFLG